MQAPITSRDAAMQMLRRELNTSLWLHRFAVVQAAQRLDIVQLNELLDLVVLAAEDYRREHPQYSDLLSERFGPQNGSQSH